MKKVIIIGYAVLISAMAFNSHSVWHFMLGLVILAAVSVAVFATFADRILD